MLDAQSVRTTRSPSPRPSPSGRGRPLAPRWASSAAFRRTDASRSARGSAAVLPLPKGEGRGEGEVRVDLHPCSKTDSSFKLTGLALKRHETRRNAFPRPTRAHSARRRRRTRAHGHQGDPELWRLRCGPGGTRCGGGRKVSRCVARLRPCGVGHAHAAIGRARNVAADSRNRSQRPRCAPEWRDAGPRQRGNRNGRSGVPAKTIRERRTARFGPPDARVAQLVERQEESIALPQMLGEQAGDRVEDLWRWIIRIVQQLASAGHLVLAHRKPRFAGGWRWLCRTAFPLRAWGPRSCDDSGWHDYL